MRKSAGRALRPSMLALIEKGEPDEAHPPRLLGIRGGGRGRGGAAVTSRVFPEFPGGSTESLHAIALIAPPACRQS